MFSPSPSRMPCSASDVRPIARAGRSQPMALRGLPFPVVASARGRAAARRIARRVAATCGLLESVLGTAPSVALRVLDRGDWHRHAEVPAYGVTHVAGNGDIVASASAADPWQDVSDHFAGCRRGRRSFRRGVVHKAFFVTVKRVLRRPLRRRQESPTIKANALLPPVLTGSSSRV